jgi:uncharacterized membrane protein YkvA (DUF1232 family)
MLSLRGGNMLRNDAPSATAAAAPRSRLQKLFERAWQRGAERVGERIGARQIPKLLDRRDRVKRELRAIPDRMQKVANQASLVLELIDDYRDGSYREIPWRSLAIASAALLYSVSPSDVVPDVLPVLGQLDDAIVIALAMRIIRSDLARYCRHKGYALEKYF